MICRSTPVIAAASLAERVRAETASMRFVHDGQTIPVSVSVGVAMSKADDTVEALIERTDKALYRAKESGRNRVVAAPEG